MYGREDAPMYSNRIRGLPNYEKFRTTRVALGILPRLNFYGEFSGDNGDDDNDSGGSNGGHDPGPSRRRRRRYMSDSESISSDSSCAGGGGGSKQIVPHHDYVGKGKEVMKAAFISSNKLTGDYGMMGRGKHQDTEETRAAGGAPPKEVTAEGGGGELLRISRHFQDGIYVSDHQKNLKSEGMEGLTNSSLAIWMGTWLIHKWQLKSLHVLQVSLPLASFLINLLLGRNQML